MFCFNDTATTGLYTYCHSLSLPDALPISCCCRCCSVACAFSSATACASIALLSASMVESRRARSASTRSFQLALSAARRSALASRARSSEEHTSELQSLLRISYAVFCLQKTNKRKYSQQSQHYKQL